VQDAIPSTTQPNAEEESAAGPSRPRDATLGPALALLRIVLGDRIPTDTLGPKTVPAAVLSHPIRLATEWLVRHVKKCRDLRCPHVPETLWRFRRMRPDAIWRATDEVHSVLWTHEDHELVAWVRNNILGEHGGIAKEISSGTLLGGDRLGDVLRDLGEDGPRIVASVLWALKFDGPNAETLFRCLVPLAQNVTVSHPGKVPEGNSAQKLQSLREKNRSLRKDLTNAREAADLANRSLRPLERLQRDLANTQRKYEKVTEERDVLRRLSDENTEALRTSEGNSAKATRVNADLRRDLHLLQQDAQELGIERSELARQSATERGQIRRLSLTLDSIPRDAEAAWRFLRAEEARIRTARTISSGGDRTRADQQWTVHRKLEDAFLAAYPAYVQPRPEKIRQKAPLRLVTLGGSAEVGRSCYLLELGKHRVLVDCGIKPRNSGDLLPEIDRLDRVDALILTHAHTDHVGWVPALIHKFGEIEIYCSTGTAALLPVVLADCHRHYMRKMAASNELARHIRNRAIVEAAYEAEDVHLVPRLATACEYNCEEALPFGDASITFFQAGHILGAASVLVRDQSGRRIFFSGDFSSFPQLTVPAARWPSDLDDLDLLVLESTYGNRTHGSFDESRRKLVSFIADTVGFKHGSVILASFALGRAQELLSMIATAQGCGEIPAVPVYVDGMIRQVNPIYQKYATFNVPKDAFLEVGGETERQEIAFAAQAKPMIIVTTSGMLAGGPVVEYAQQLLPEARNRIVFSGYQDEGAPSRALLDLVRSGGGPRLVELLDEGGNQIRFEAAMPAEHVGLSSHADQPGLVEFASRLRSKVIALVHGEPDAQSALQARLALTHPRSEIVCGPLDLPVP
jgi:uncharacterized protein